MTNQMKHKNQKSTEKERECPVVDYMGNIDNVDLKYATMSSIELNNIHAEVKEIENGNRVKISGLTYVCELFDKCKTVVDFNTFHKSTIPSIGKIHGTKDDYTVYKNLNSIRDILGQEHIEPPRDDFYTRNML